MDARSWVPVVGALILGIAMGRAMGRHEGPSLAAAAHPQRYRLLQDRDLYTEAAAPRREEFQDKLEKIAREGWELVNPSAAYFEDKGFVAVTGDFPADAKYPDRRAVLILRRP